MPKQTLFAKIQSRLGLINAPHKETHANFGVEYGSTKILSRKFINSFANAKEIDFIFSMPEQVSPQNYYQILTEEYNALIAEIASKLTPEKMLVSVGGDHSISLGSIGAILKIHNPLKTGIIMIDSHGDIHQPSTSPSGNFHGMWLRPIVDGFEIASIDKLIPIKVPPSNLIYLGNLDLEIEEKQFMHINKIMNFNQKKLNNPEFINIFETFLANKEHIHVSIDIDAFNHEFAPATGMLITKGLIPEDIFPVLDRLKKYQSLSIDLVEVNPKLKGHIQTIKFAQEILTRLIA